MGLNIKCQAFFLLLDEDGSINMKRGSIKLGIGSINSKGGSNKKELKNIYRTKLKVTSIQSRI
jgi:hypothetical protein